MTAVSSVAVTKDPSAERHSQAEEGAHGNLEMGDLQQRLHVTRSRYQQAREGNARLWAILSDINLEEKLLMERSNERNSGGLSGHRFEFSNALQDLISSFKEVTRAASAVEEPSVYR
ncbi:uncharacterized protein Tco025E_00545 [Trypanosoma conorhini]|uniref:Uncharacterized protein n=1 Tax=Trypanosoma conorhini TaxID=83891 RepID=A0A3R7N8M4_9TRYP|nr:uncharacterized protein Tco025E_00545 [Trypanosoma conorhini]RNF27237.1 hypothetical protein Tco025E_00545 [Trypanosoma conorhini]